MQVTAEISTVMPLYGVILVWPAGGSCEHLVDEIFEADSDVIAVGDGGTLALLSSAEDHQPRIVIGLGEAGEALPAPWEATTGQTLPLDVPEGSLRVHNGLSEPDVDVDLAAGRYVVDVFRAGEEELAAVDPVERTSTVGVEQWLLRFRRVG